METGLKARVLLGIAMIPILGGLGYEWVHEIKQGANAGWQTQATQNASSIQKAVQTIENPAALHTSGDKDALVDQIAWSSMKLGESGPKYLDEETWKATKTALDKVNDPHGGILDDVQLEVIGNSRRTLRNAGFNMK